MLIRVSFMGANAFCLKICDPNGHNQGQFCQNIYDRLGCAYNAPSNAKNGSFEVCDGDVMTPPGVYVENGQTQTYFQPPESQGPITHIPYTPAVPSSSNCVTYQSTALYSNLPSPAVGAGAGNRKNPPSRSPTAGVAASTSNDASVVAISSFATVAGVVFAMVFLA